MTEWREIAEAPTGKVTGVRNATCPKHGVYESVGREYSGWSGCEQCQQEKVRQFEEREAARKLAEGFERAKIPDRFRGKTFDTYQAATEGQKRALEAVRKYGNGFAENLELGRCLTLLGSVGTGKTHLACALIDALIRAGYRCRYGTVAELIRSIRSTWSKDGRTTDWGSTELEILQRCAAYDLLVLDEVGLQFGTDSELAQLSEIIDLRYREMKPTVLISNCDVTGLERYIGTRALDRLRENGGKVVLFNWQSWRKHGDAARSKNHSSGEAVNA